MAERMPPLKPSMAPVEATPVVDGPFGLHDTFRKGFSSVRQQVQPVHPVEHMQKHSMQNDERIKLHVARAVQGRAAAMHIQMERSILAKERRLPVLHSSMLGLEISLGRDSDLTFEDTLNDPRDPEVLGDVHAMTEASPYFQ